MRLFFNIFLSLLFLFLLENSVYSLSDYEIRQLCKKQPKRISCIKNLKIKNLELLKGNRIEIPVIPYED